MSTLLQPSQHSTHPDSPVNAIARASGAAPIPEVDGERLRLSKERIWRAVGKIARNTRQQMTQRRSLKDIMAAQDSSAGLPMQTHVLLVMFLALFGIYAVATILPAATIIGAASAESAALAMIVDTSLSLVIGLAAIFVTQQTFARTFGSFPSILLRLLVINAALDLVVLGLSSAVEGWMATTASVPVAAALLMWMFRLTFPQMVVVLLVNVLGRALFAAAVVGLANAP